MVRFLLAVGEVDRVDEVLDAAVQWAIGLAADMCLPDHTLTTEEPDFSMALRLLVDRLDCPSKMVQERAAWSLAGLLSNTDTREDTASVLLVWHSAEALELRSCMILLILHLAHIAHGTFVSLCLDVARQANLVPSIGVDLLLHQFGERGAEFAETLNYREMHSGRPVKEFSGVNDFKLTVKGHLAPIFWVWANNLDKYGIPFTRQWQWEVDNLANQQGLSLRLNAYFGYHFRRGSDGSSLAINDRLSVVLRSAYLRALHWSINEVGL